MLFQYVNGQASREIIAHRKDSRVEVLLKTESQFDFVDFEQKLQQALKS